MVSKAPNSRAAQSPSAMDRGGSKRSRPARRNAMSSPNASSHEMTRRPHAEQPYRPISAALAIAPAVSVIIPARNEAANLPHVFRTLPPWVDEVVLVDGNSVDDTVAVTRTLRPSAKVVNQPGTGKGDALRAGFAAATGDILVTIDADGSTDGAELIRFVSVLVAGADFAKGSRFSSSGGSDDITGVRRYGNRALSILVNWMFGTHFTDLCYGYNAFWARHLDALEVSGGPGFEVETLMSIRAAKAGLRIYEVPSHECPRIFGASNLRAARDGWRILKVILREWLRGVPSRGLRQATPPTAGPELTGGPAVAPNRGPSSERKGAKDGGKMVTAAFDQYAQGLYTYCRSLLSDPAAAADALRDTFVVASAELSQLRQPERVRAWLFAVARNECHMRLRTETASPSLYVAAHAMDDTGAFGIFSEQTEYRTMVRAALAGMDPVDREISELNLRHRFYGADLADILGAPRNRAHVLASRARSRFERSLGVLPVARSEPGHCPDLASILNGEAHQSTGPVGWQVKRHVGRCRVCGERRRSGLNPLMLLNLLPLIPLPGDLRKQTLELVSDQSTAAVAHRDQVLDRAAPLGADGFPVQLSSTPAPGRRVSALAAVAAAAAAAALLGGAMYHVGHQPAQTGHIAAAVPRPPVWARPSGSGTTPAGSLPPTIRAPLPTPGLIPFAPASTGPSASPSASPSPTPTCKRSRRRLHSRSRSRACPRAATHSPAPKSSPSLSPPSSQSPSPTPSASTSVTATSSSPLTRVRLNESGLQIEIP